MRRSGKARSKEASSETSMTLGATGRDCVVYGIDRSGALYCKRPMLDRYRPGTWAVGVSLQ